jgi:hypothetical protein
MKIKKIHDTQRFFQKLCECKGSVELITSHGDRLNLKATLCQYISLTEMFTDANIHDIEIIFSEPEDCYLLTEFLITT